MPGIKIENLPRETNIDCIYRGVLPLSIDGETVGTVFGVALGNVTNCLDIAYTGYFDLTSITTFLSGESDTNKACIDNLLFTAASADGEIIQLGDQIKTKANLTCFTFLDQGLTALNNRINQNISDISTLDSGITSLNDGLTLRANITDVSNLQQHITALNTDIVNNQNNIRTAETNIDGKAGCNEITTINGCFETLNTRLATSSIYLDTAAADILTLCTLVGTNSATINASNISFLSACIDSNCNSAAANTSTIETLNTRMSDITSVSAIALAAEASRLQTLNTDLETTGARAFSNETKLTELDSTINVTISSVRNLSSACDIFYSDLASQASRINTLETNIVTSAARIFANEQCTTDLNSTLTTQISNVRNLSAFRDVITVCVDAKASANRVDGLQTQLDTQAIDINNNALRTISLSSSVDDFTQNTLTPTFTSIVNSINAKSDSTVTDGLCALIALNETQIASIKQQQTSLSNSFNTLDSTTISAISSQLASTKHSGAYSALTAKATLNDFTFLSASIDTQVAKVNTVISDINTLSAKVQSLSSTALGFISGCIDLRAQCCDVQAINTCLDDNTFIKTCDFNTRTTDINSSIQRVDQDLTDQISILDPNSPDNPTGNLRTDIDEISGNLSGTNAEINTTVTVLCAGIEGLSGTVFKGLSSTIDSIGTDVDALCGLTDTLNFSADNLENQTIFLVNSKATKTCTDGLATNISTNLASLNIGFANSAFLSGEIENLSAASMSFLSGCIDARATVACVDTINNSLITSAALVEANRVCSLTLDTEITSLSNTTAGLFLTADAAFELKASTTLADTINATLTTQQLSAEALCQKETTLISLISTYNGGDSCVSVGQLENLAAKVNTNTGSINSIKSCQTCLNSIINNNKTATDVGINAANQTLISQATDIQGLQSCVSSCLGIDGPVFANATNITNLNSCVTTLNDRLLGCANANAVSNLQATVGNNTASIEEVRQVSVAASEDATLAKQTAENVGGSIANLNTIANDNTTKVSCIESKYTIKVDACGAVAGYGLIACNNQGNCTSEFRVNANCFIVEDQVGGGISPINPFIVQGNKVKINAACITDLCGSCIRANSLNVGGVAIGGSIGITDGVAGCDVYGFTNNPGPNFANCVDQCCFSSQFVEGCFGRVKNPNNMGLMYRKRCNFDLTDNAFSSNTFIDNPPYHIAECCQCLTKVAFICYGTSFPYCAIATCPNNTVIPKGGVMGYDYGYYKVNCLGGEEYERCQLFDESTGYCCIADSEGFIFSTEMQFCDNPVTGHSLVDTQYGCPGPLFFTKFKTFNFPSASKKFVVRAGIQQVGRFNFSSETGFALAMRETDKFFDYRCKSSSDYVYMDRINSSGTAVVGDALFSSVVDLKPDTCYHIWFFGINYEFSFSKVRGMQNGYITVVGLNK